MMIQVRKKQPRCNCVACGGMTIAYARRRLVEDAKWLVKLGICTQEVADKLVSDFNDIHAEKIGVNGND